MKLSNSNVEVDIQCTFPLTREEQLILSNILKRMKRMGIAPKDRDHVILALDKELAAARSKLQEFEKHNGGVSPKISYLCDRRACNRCMPANPGCRHTSDVRHAKNFELRGYTFVELERADE